MYRKCIAFPEAPETKFTPLCSLGDEKPSGRPSHYSMVYDEKKPDLVFEFRYRSLPMLQALNIIPLPKREAPLIIDLEDEDILPPPKCRKAAHNDEIVRSMQVRNI